MEEQFWQIVNAYGAPRWWFGAPALLLCVGALVALALAAVRLRRCSVLGIACAVPALAAAAALLAPAALLAWRPLAALGIDHPALAQLTTATFPAVALALDRAQHQSVLGAGALVVGLVGALGGLGLRRGATCAACGRAQHPSWQGACPECLLMEAGGPPLRPGDLPLTQLGGMAQTTLLDDAATHTAWVELLQPSGEPAERCAVGSRLTIGRDPGQCQLVVDDEASSARHAYIERTGDAFVLYDWGSRNGTRVCGELVAQRTLRDGDEIGVGRAKLRFVLPPLTPDCTATELLLPEAMCARLVVLNGPAAGQVFAITQLDVQIGRGKQNDLVLDVPSVSRQHASVRFDGMDYYLLDAGSPNGTWLDEKRVLSSTCLTAGQIIRLGGQRLRFERMEAGDVAQH